jgi:Tol biopolymer transport system component
MSLSSRHLALVLLVLGLCGCGGSSDEGSAPPRSASPSTRSSDGAALSGKIVFRRFLDAEEKQGALFVRNADGSDERQLTRPLVGVVDDNPDWSPDGTHILFDRYTNVGTDKEVHRIFVMAADGTGQTPLTAGCVPTSPDVICGFNGTGAFSPDGRQIVYARQSGPVKDDQIAQSDVYVMDADGKNPRRITHNVPYSGDVGGFAWSPDATKIVFAVTHDLTHAAGQTLVLINADGTGRRLLTPYSLGANGTPDWSAAMNLIVFRAVSDEESGIGNFFTIRPDGTGLTQVTHLDATVISHKVGFSPDGRRIVFAHETADGVNNLFTCLLDGSDVRTVAVSAHADSSPDWDPTG